MLIPIDTTVINNELDEKYEERKRLLKQAIHVLGQRVVSLKYASGDHTMEINATVKQLDKLKRELEELEQESKKK